MNTAPEGESCGCCRFYLGGECHSNPPSVWLPATNYLDALADPSTRIMVSWPSRIMVSWPRVELGDWCGQFIKNVQPQPQS